MSHGISHNPTVRSIPVWLSWIKFVSWFYYGYSALMINQWAGVEDISCDIQEIGNQTLASCIRTGEDVLDKFAIDQVSQ